jgi:beta-glucosidase
MRGARSNRPQHGRAWFFGSRSRARDLDLAPFALWVIGVIRMFSLGRWVVFAVPVLCACGSPPGAVSQAPPTRGAPTVSAEASGQCLLPRQPQRAIAAHPGGGFPRQACIDLASELVSRLPLEYKLSQMVQVERGAIGNGHDVELLGVGSVLSGGGSAPVENTAFAWAKMVNEFRRRSLDSYTHIPLIYGVDAVHGHNNVHGAVLFPHNIGLGATRDPDLVQRIGAATAEAVAGTNIDWTFAPVVTAARDDRWGRTYEAFGEHPELAELLGPAAIRGIQGEALGRGPNSVLACAKHFVGDGYTMGGEDRGNAPLSLDDVRKSLLPAYQKSIEAGVGSIMVSFSSLEGIKMHCHGPMLTDVLKGELGFNGFLVSDWQAVELLPGDYALQLESAINAGLDMVMHPESYRQFLTTMQELVPERIPLVRIDDAVTRILTAKCELGLFKKDRFYLDRSGQLAIDGPIDSIGSKAHRELAREAVRKSLVLLKNEQSRLPLRKGMRKIVVAGRNANDIGNQSGGWSIAWQGQSGAITPGTTIFGGIATVSGALEAYHSEDGSDVSGAEVAVLVLGETPYAEGKGDDPDLALDPRDVQAAGRIHAAGIPLVVVVISGRPLILDPILPLADAIVAAWLPGTEGQGVADVLFGDAPFVGLLPVSWPRSVEQEPINVGDPNYDPLFPYGFGLSTSASLPGAAASQSPAGGAPTPGAAPPPGVAPSPGVPAP